MSVNIIRVDEIPLSDMFHHANSLQELFDYKPMQCYSNYVPLHDPEQPDIGEAYDLRSANFQLQIHLLVW